MPTSADYELSRKAYRKGKANVTRARNKGDHAKVVAICDETLDIFEDSVYPDDWAHFQRAKDDALLAILYGRA